MIKGLRKVAGLVMLNKTLSSNDSAVFYDALHIWEASLRGNKAQLIHYECGVQGYGGITSKKLREKFFESITIITEKLKLESDPKLIV